MSPEAKKIIAQGVKNLLITVIPMAGVPIFMTLMMNRSESIWVKIISTLLIFIVIGMLIRSISIIVKGIFYDEEN
jgi:hypothetical protein